MVTAVDGDGGFFSVSATERSRRFAEMNDMKCNWIKYRGIASNKRYTCRKQTTPTANSNRKKYIKHAFIIVLFEIRCMHIYDICNK